MGPSYDHAEKSVLMTTLFLRSLFTFIVGLLFTLTLFFGEPAA